MSLSRMFVVTGALLLPIAAHAADMPRFPRPSTLPDAPTRVIEEYTSGWYLRLDGAYRFNRIGSATFDNGTGPTSTKIDSSPLLGLGAGYKYDFLRADITADYGGRTSFKGMTGALDTPSARIDGFTVLANGYFDLGTWWGITPYLGGGAGVSYLSASDYSSLPPSIPTVITQTTTNFAWAYMAGASFRVFPNLLIDVGYRHINLGDAITGPDNNHLNIKKISADEIRVGLRYTLD